MDSGVDWKGKGNDVQHAVEPVRGRGEKVSKMRDNIPKSSVININYFYYYSDLLQKGKKSNPD